MNIQSQQLNRNEIEYIPNVSVIIPCYNYAHYLIEAVESVINQSFQDFEIIIINDGSTDNTVEIAEQLIKKYPQNSIKLINQKNTGKPSFSRNTGIRQARGEFILCLDADDYLHSDYIRAISIFEANPEISIVYPDQIHVVEGKNYFQPSIDYDKNQLLYKNLLPTAALFRKKAWEDVGGYRENLKAYEDWDFWIACSAKGHSGKRMAKPLFYYRIHGKSLTSYSDEHDYELKQQIILNNPEVYPAVVVKKANEYFEKEHNNPLVSIIIPCYNQALFLAESAESVVSQTFTDWEIIIVNDGSPDNTNEIAQKLINKYPNFKIKLIEKINGGLSSARNVGIRNANGIFILPLDADDKLGPAFLEKCAKILNDNPDISIVYTDVQEFGELHRMIPSIEYNFNVLLIMNYITATALYRKSIWETIDGYNENMKQGYEDWDFWISCGERGFKGYRISEPLFYYRKRKESMVHSESIQNDKQLKAQIVLNHSQLYSTEQIRWAKLVLDGNPEALAIESGAFIPEFENSKITAKLSDTELKKSINVREYKMKILFTMYGWNESGGGTIYPKAIAHELVRRGYDVSVFYAGLKNNPEEPAYSIEKSYDSGVRLFGLYNRPAVFIDPDFPEREINDENVLIRFIEVCDEVKPDVIHFHNFHGLTLAMARIAREKNIPSCYTPHNYHIIDPNLYLFHKDLSLWNGIDMIENSSAVKQNPDKLDLYKQRIQTSRKVINEWVDLTLAVSNRQRELLIAHGGNEKKITVVHQANPIIDELWQSSHLDNVSKREISEHLRFGFIGGVMPHKGVHIIVAAAQYFMPNDIEFHIYGFVSEQYLKLLKEIDKKNIVKFHGVYDNSQLEEIAENLDVAILPSIWEDCAPLVLLELNAMRLPVIAAKIGGVPDFIKEGLNGYLYQYDSVESLIKTIMYCTVNPDIVKEMRQNMQRIHSFKSYMNHLEKIYDALLNKKITDTKELWLTVNFNDLVIKSLPALINEEKVAADEDSIRRFLESGGLELLEYSRKNGNEDLVDLLLLIRARKPVLIEEFMDSFQTNEKLITVSSKIIQNIENVIDDAVQETAHNSHSEDFLGFSFDTKRTARTLFTEMQDPYNHFEKLQPPYLNIVWEGSQFVYHSLALINREHCSNLIDTEVVEVTIIPYENDQFSPYGNEKYEKLHRHDIRYKPDPPEEIRNLPYIWIRHQWPPQSDPPKGAKWIINQPWEFSQLRKDFVEIFKQADEVWTPSNYSRKCFIDSGLDFNKVQIIPNGIDPDLFKPYGDKYPLKTEKRFKYLFVGGTIFRKGCDILLNSFLKAFTNQDDVCLVIKDMGGDSFYRGQTLKEQILKQRIVINSPEIIYIDDYMSEPEIASLYRSCDVFVCSYRGEGFSLPTLEAMACGLPVIVTDGGSTDDFVTDEIGWKIPATKVSIGDKIGEIFTGEAFVLEPDAEYLMKLMKNIFIYPLDVFTKGVLAQQTARTLWTWKRATTKIFARLDALYNMNMQRQAAEKLIDKDDVYILTGKAENQFFNRNFENAIELYEKVLTSNDLSEKYRLLCLCRISSIYLIEKDLEKAEEFLSKAMELATDHPDTLYIKAKIHSQRKEWTESMETFSEILSKWKTWKYDTLTGIGHDELLTGTADGIFNTGDPEGAFKLYNEALKMNNNNSDACLGAAKYFILVDMKDDAINMLQWAIKLNPYLEEAYQIMDSLK